MTLIRWPFQLFNGLSQQQRAVDGVSQGYRCGNIAFQGGYDARNSSCAFSPYGNDRAYGQANSDYAVQVGHTGRMLEIGNWEGYRGHLNILASQSNYAGIQSVNDLSHGSYTLSLKARFGRSCRAFVNAWRAS
jgi:hypothetical protein